MACKVSTALVRVASIDCNALIGHNGITLLKAAVATLTALSLKMITKLLQLC